MVPRSKTSAGILLFRRTASDIEVFLVHPGGPLFIDRDNGVWSIPKGEYDQGHDDPLESARREFLEETGTSVAGSFRELTAITQPSGKIVRAWAIEGDIDACTIASSHFTMEWPPDSGMRQEFPEVDRGGWFSIAESIQKILPEQRAFVLELQRLLEPADASLSN
jgi:predicted NUDIX family NTP pyrophosphohydrolase